MNGTFEEFMDLCDDCDERESRLSDWERKFIDSIRAQIGKRVPLSDKQDEILNEIWEKATRNG